MSEIRGWASAGLLYWLRYTITAVSVRPHPGAVRYGARHVLSAVDGGK